MINLTVKHEGIKHKVQVPEDWSEVSYGTYLKMIKETEPDDIFLASLNLPNEIKEATNLVELYVITEQLKSKVYNVKPNFDYNSKHRLVTIEGESVLTPKDITSKSIAQYEDCKHLLKDCFDADGKIIHEKYNNALGLVFAIYLQGLDDKYNYDKAEVLLPFVNDLPCEQVISVASFFLNKLFKKKKNILSRCLLALKMIKEKGLVITI